MLVGCSAISASATSVSSLAGYLRTNWSRDPFALGSYSYAARAERRGDRAALAEPLGGSVFFAGEACHPHYNSTVHAAYESGQMTARAVAEGRARRIAVIGAGTSGLRAAQVLSEQGREVTVFEARERIGGRLWTSEQLGAPLDLGASWIHGPIGNPLTALADEVEARRVQTDDSYAVRGGDGQKISSWRAPGWLFDEAEAQAAFAADLDLIDPSVLEKGDGYSGDDVIFPGGYAAILAAVRGDYRVQLSTTLRNVNHSQDGAVLTLADEAGDLSEAQFDAAIITVALGVLKSGAIAFDPVLPAAKRGAIERIGMGTLDKLYLKFEAPFWDDVTWIYTPETGLPRGQLNQWLNLMPYIGEPVLAAFSGGSAALALAQLSDSELLDLALGTLTSAYSQ